MFSHYLQLGLRSLRRNPVLTVLMVVAIGFGVGASMTTYSVFRATSRNPIPEKSDVLYNVQIDNYGPAKTDGGKLPEALSYRDAMALQRAHRAPRQTVTYPVGLSIIPDDPSQLPVRKGAYATGADFFPMFEVPFIQGGPWTQADDDRHASVAVISRSLNDKLFNGGKSIGRQVNLDGRLFRVVGVIEDWAPQPLFFDVPNSGGFTEGASVYVPFTRAMDLKMPNSGNNGCPKDAGDGWENYLASECVWLSLWVELPDRAAADAYRHFLEAYATDQQRSGRFEWHPAVALLNVMDWLAVEKVVPPESQVSLIVSVAFLVICLINTVGLLLAKFMRRAPEIGIRRALGASRRAIYMQFLSEAAAVGFAGGVLGLLLTGIGILGVGLVFPKDIARLATIDPMLVLLTLAVAVLATIVAAFYPTWRAAQVQPAWQLKSN